jgi:uncharacterized protein with HEPN domain
MAMSAILREIGIIGEAVNALPEAVTAKTARDRRGRNFVRWQFTS